MSHPAPQSQTGEGLELQQTPASVVVGGASETISSSSPPRSSLHPSATTATDPPTESAPLQPSLVTTPVTTTTTNITSSERSGPVGAKMATPMITQKQREDIKAAEADAAGTAIAHTHDAPLVSLALLPPTGRRHPYQIDIAYLRKRHVEVEADDPWNLPVAKLKELILRDWRDDWETPPSSAAQIRLICMGNEFQEGELLRDKRLNRSGTNIVHMVLSRPIPEEEEMKGDSENPKSREDGRQSACCCVLM